MTDNERELIHIIREHNAPEQDLIVALDIILNYLTRRVLFESTPSVDSRGFAETSQA